MSRMSVQQAIMDAGSGYLADALAGLEQQAAGLHTPWAMMARELAQGIRAELGHRNGRLPKAELFGYLGTGVSGIVHLTDSQGQKHSGMVQSIQREDGTGSSFNVTLTDGTRFHVRTLD